MKISPSLFDIDDSHSTVSRKKSSDGAVETARTYKEKLKEYEQKQRSKKPEETSQEG
jgi:hypothetical protein